MKKPIFLLAIVSLLVSCGEKEFYSVSIVNESSKTVSYAYNGSQDSLGVSASKAYEVKAYTQPPKDAADEYGIASITMKNHRGEKYTFEDAKPLTLSVINTLPVQITIKAGNYIDNSGLMELTIPANNDEANFPGVVIYTRNPSFTATSNYPVIITWNIVGAETEGEKDEMAVIIR